MTIGELAKKSGLSVDAIRYYERERLLSRAHRWRDNNYRDFDDEAVARLKFIRAAKEAGFTLREIRQLLDAKILPNEACDSVGPLVTQKLTDIDRRISEMRRFRKLLVRLKAAGRECTAGEPCVVLAKLET